MDTGFAVVVRLGRVVGLVALCLGALVTLGAPRVAAQDPGPLPPSLAGELLLTGDQINGTNAGGSYAITGSTCNADFSGSFSYIAQGTATGPYPGTFVEEGTITFGPVYLEDFGQNVSAITSFNATFTIVSGDTTINGSKTGTGAAPSAGPGSPLIPAGTSTNIAVCADANIHLFRLDHSYQAMITTPAGQFTDSGIGDLDVAVVAFDESGSPVFRFGEGFYVSNGVVAVPTDPEMPTTKEQCKYGGYANYGFPNQGQCIQYVNTGK